MDTLLDLIATELLKAALRRALARPATGRGRHAVRLARLVVDAL